mmetsp:Transcript_13676/g.30167  ORF Transcript_13676/g.30167 Transcript_13676/m.30167 type:complete len:241 (-) Transcript_13676:2934-3656(-)
MSRTTTLRPISTGADTSPVAPTPGVCPPIPLVLSPPMTAAASMLLQTGISLPDLPAKGVFAPAASSADSSSIIAALLDPIVAISATPPLPIPTTFLDPPCPPSAVIAARPQPPPAVHDQSFAGVAAPTADLCPLGVSAALWPRDACWTPCPRHQSWLPVPQSLPLPWQTQTPILPLCHCRRRPRPYGLLLLRPCHLYSPISLARCLFATVYLPQWIPAPCALFPLQLLCRRGLFLRQCQC